MSKNKPQEIQLKYEFFWKDPRYDYINLGKNKAKTRTKTNKNRRRVLKVNLVEDTRKEYEFIFDLRKYRKSTSGGTVHCYPHKHEKAEDYFKRFEPVATAEYIRARQNLINFAAALAYPSFTK